MCPEEGKLESTFDDGTGSYGALFDVLAKTDLTLTGIDLNVSYIGLLVHTCRCFRLDFQGYLTHIVFLLHTRWTGTLDRLHTY